MSDSYFCLWPIYKEKVEDDSEDKLVHTLPVIEIEKIVDIGKLISIERFNDTCKLLKVTAIVHGSVASKHFIT